MRKLLLIFVLCCLGSALLAQRVSLVFSGGGAKGLAHIGVIKALEENEIPISTISGTSMGAIVGGLYAMGYSPDEMIALFKSSDFNNWSQGKIDDAFRYNINDFSWSDAENLSIGFVADKKGIKPKILSSLIPTVGMDLAFDEMFAQANAVSAGDFDKLFVPFRCNASDIVSKKTIYFRRGNLGAAIRASMSFPMYFRPIYVDSVLLFDGGIYNNFLWQEAYRDFNPDVIVGSKVAANSDLPTDDDPLLQVETMIVGDTNYDIPDSLGFLVDIPFTDVSLLDFDRVDEIVEVGYRSAMAIIPELKKRIHGFVRVEAVNDARKAFRASFPALNIKEIDVVGLSAKKEKYINRILLEKKKVVGLETFKRNYYRLMSDRVFVRLYPTLILDSVQGSFDVRIDAKLKRSVDIGAGLSLSSYLGNEGFISGNYSWLSRTSNTLYGNLYFGRFYSSGRATYAKAFPSKVPISAILQFVGSRFDYHSGNSIPFFEDLKPAYIIQSEFVGALGVKVSRSSAVNYSLMFSLGEKDDDYYQVENYYSYDIPDKTRLRFAKGALRYEKLTLNSKQFATRGRRQVLALSGFVGTETHFPGSTAPTILKSQSDHVFASAYIHNESYHRVWGQRFWIGFRFDGYWSNQHFFNNYYATILSLNQYSPSPHSSSLFFENYRASQYVAMGGMPIIGISKNFHLRFELYCFQPIKTINTDSNGKPYYGEQFKERWFMGSSSLVYQSPIGPMSISAAYYPFSGGKQELYYTFTFGYSLYNPRVFDN
ncbi:MAG: patatin-like phospholipase family protein [Bacteroidales bacterium]|nr:patatin-like phospholipase family protein [Bacteroidales bacterium]